MEDELDTSSDQLVTGDGTQGEQADGADNSFADDADGQSDGGIEEKLLAGKYKSPEDLEKAYKELESKLGSLPQIEAKARQFDQLTNAQARTAPQMKPENFVDKDGNFDLMAYNQYVQKETSRVARLVAQEQVDVERAEKDFPYLVADPDAADAVMGMYQSGKAASIYEAAKRLDKLRSSSSEAARNRGAQEKEREIAQKVRSKTEGAGTKVTSGGITPEAFAKMSLEEKRNLINSFGA